MIVFCLIASLFSIIAQPDLPPLSVDPFVQTEEVVKTYSENHPAVLARCQPYLEEIRALEAKGKISKEDTSRILDAIAFAAEKHQHQKRKNAEQTPYIIHPLGVSYTLVTLGKVEEANILIAALLHDTVEDTETTFEEIRARFGAEVEGYVRELTDDKSLSQEERKRLQIVHAPHKSPGAALIKLSDKLYNLNDLILNPPEDWSQERRDLYFVWAKEVVDNLPVVNDALKKAFRKVCELHAAV